jgi:hypothetical protein
VNDYGDENGKRSVIGIVNRSRRRSRQPKAVEKQKECPGWVGLLTTKNTGNTEKRTVSVVAKHRIWKLIFVFFVVFVVN